MAASREEVFERVKEVLVEQLGVDENEITEEASFQEDLDADSLDLVELIMELEDQFGIKISDEDAQKITTVGQAVDYVSSHQQLDRGRRRARSSDRPAAVGTARRGLHPSLLGGGPHDVVRAARVSRRRRARRRDCASPVPRAPRLRRGPDDQALGARALADCVCRGRGRARLRAPAAHPGGGARRRGGPEPEPQRQGAGGRARGGARRPLPPAVARADRGGGRRGVLRADRVRAPQFIRREDGADGVPRQGRPQGCLPGARGRGAAARPYVHLRRAGRRRAARERDREDEEGRGAGGRPRGARRTTHLAVSGAAPASRRSAPSSRRPRISLIQCVSSAGRKPRCAVKRATCAGAPSAPPLAGRDGRLGPPAVREPWRNRRALRVARVLRNPSADSKGAASAAPVRVLASMHLSAIRLRGVKSFVDPVEVRLEPGVAVVVGPNGSGKSNVADGIVWATGSLSPHELRAEKPDDVLFAGSAGRKAVDFCEVELVFDNEDAAWPELPFSAVSLARRLHRGGEGQYLVNRATVRRIDLIELLSDVGLGGGLRSVISQGSVETVLGAKPAERRALVEG